MDTLIHRAESRGGADHGWLKTRYSFSFANYYNPDRMGFGALRVLNDDLVEGGGGFGTHPHENMEIVTVMLDGALKHRDDTGNEEVLRAGEVQVMSAGTGIQHSEFNGSATDPCQLLQVWVVPNRKGVTPRYEQKSFTEGNRNAWQTLVSSDGRDGSLWMHQDALFLRGQFDAGSSTIHAPQQPDRGVYLFVISGKIEVGGEVFQKRDALGIRDAAQIQVSVLEDSDLLLIEIPL